MWSGRTIGRAIGRLAIVAAVLIGVTGGATPATPPATTSRLAPVPAETCPSGGRIVPAGTPLQPELDKAQFGAVLCLSPGVYVGPVVIKAPVRLVGSSEAVIKSTGQGTTIRVVSPNVELRGFTVDGSGDRVDIMDGAIYVRADDVAIRDVTIRHALFGLVAERCQRVVFERNHIIGDPTAPEGLRGDGIRFWEVQDATITTNRLEDSRDIVVWYSPRNTVSGNTIVRSRYGTHFMYSSDCIVQGNRYEQNVVGVFIMYSRGITVRDNIITDNTGADGMGLGVKESGNVVVERNQFVRDRECLYFDNSPFREGDRMTVRSNVIALCTAGVTFHNSERDTTFADNRFQGNETAVAVEGRGTALAVTWHGNYFDDYRGYDMNRDGFGDVPYELRDLSERLIARQPALALFRGTAALALIDVAAQAFPVLQPEKVLVDDRPRMAPPAESQKPASASVGSGFSRTQK